MPDWSCSMQTRSTNSTEGKLRYETSTYLVMVLAASCLQSFPLSQESRISFLCNGYVDLQFVRCLKQEEETWLGSTASQRELVCGGT